MEILATIVVDQGNHRCLELRGEGGESIKVTLTSRPPETSEECTARAKAILIQAATVHQAPNMGFTEHPQPQWFALEYLDKGEVRVMPGVEFPSVEAVQGEVMRSAKDLWTDALSREETPTGWAVRARDSNGNVVASVAFEELQQSMNSEEASTADH
ncbi:DUF6894 family protein [Mesorhizobium sp. IMUNJ 23232]|uniref:DUF6894 family protein n=1 Tax=Mesorhizobium sp. IMUNJ 23232 TaxID=3376064 RepID=UPI0037A5CA1F